MLTNEQKKKILKTHLMLWKKAREYTKNKSYFFISDKNMTLPKTIDGDLYILGDYAEDDVDLKKIGTTHVKGNIYLFGSGIEVNLTGGKDIYISNLAGPLYNSLTKETISSNDDYKKNYVANNIILSNRSEIDAASKIYINNFVGQRARVKNMAVFEGNIQKENATITCHFVLNKGHIKGQQVRFINKSTNVGKIKAKRVISFFNFASNNNDGFAHATDLIEFKVQSFNDGSIETYRDVVFDNSKNLQNGIVTVHRSAQFLNASYNEGVIKIGGSVSFDSSSTDKGKVIIFQ